MDYNDTYAGAFSYHNITRSQISIDKYNGQSNRVEIPEKISGQEVIEIGEGAFWDNLILECVQLLDSVTAIKDNAYYGWRNLKIVHLGMGIKSIGDNTFAECESLQTIQVRSKLDYLGKNVLSLLYFTEGSSSPSDERKEGDTMYVTYQDLIQIGIFVVALGNLIYQIYKGKKK